MKYQQDISSTLKLLALGLVFFVGYQVWLKPTYLTPAPTVPERAATVSLPSSLEPTSLEIQKSPPWDVPPSRLIELGSPAIPMLGSIRDELDRGNYNEVERRLRHLSPNRFVKVPVRRYIAALWNNLGVQQEKFGGTQLSVKAFKQAVTWDPTNPTAHLNLTQAYWELRDPELTPKFLETVIRLSPRDPFPHLALADLLVSKGNIAAAATHLAQARPRAERDPNHQSYLRGLMAKVEAMEPARTTAGGASQAPEAHDSQIARSSESPVVPSTAPSPEPTSPTRVTAVTTSQTPARQSTLPSAAHFTVRYEGPPDEATWVRMRAILDYAFEELSQKFGHVSSKPIAVVLHTNQRFTGAGGSPAWADTLFDQSTGTIHLPTQEALEDLAVFSRVARHEFVHALFYEYLKGGTSGVPSWLIEGLAMQLAEDPWSDLEETGGKLASITPLTSLQGDWKQFPEDTLRIAYLEARSATQNLVDRYSMYGVRQVMNQLQSGRSLDAAMQQKLSVSYEQFQRQWEQTYRLSMKSSGS
ncbi:MAG TPA: hypothetical protein VLE03_00830 [Nitrospiraceae bacterium]|nr:hypothetical protein [Nitrospiraceae bacterium]